MRFKSSLSIFGFFLFIPLLLLAGLATQIPVSVWGIGYLLGGLTLAFGLTLSPWRTVWLATGTGALTLLLLTVTRVGLGIWEPHPVLEMLTLPSGDSAPWLGYVIDEQDAVIFGETLFHQIGGSSAREHVGIAEALNADYSSLRQVQAVMPSPVLDTYLGLQGAEGFDTIFIKPEANSHPETAVVFLHGFGGNVTAQCWEISRAASRFGALTVCPSTGWQGQWWQPDGEASLRAALRYLTSERGIRNIYLGGFSNGGFGLNRLAPKLTDEKALRGLFFIDGIAKSAEIRALGLPVLVIQGSQDERMPALEAHRIVGEIGNLGTYVEIAGDHFLIMKEPAAVQTALSAWLEKQAGK
ncbi:alpha/beta hydrolase [Synechocystis sp. LKSZ1]|uniref:alpha/beta hydrolase n=1 Tax=Synechocystis sp. LKSZ1 TaxID=3144951 RepID=UPI00336BFACF